MSGIRDWVIYTYIYLMYDRPLLFAPFREIPVTRPRVKRFNSLPFRVDGRPHSENQRQVEPSSGRANSRLVLPMDLQVSAVVNRHCANPLFHHRARSDNSPAKTKKASCYSLPSLGGGRISSGYNHMRQCSGNLERTHHRLQSTRHL